MDIISLIERLIYNFTWRRLFTFLLFFSMLFAGAFAYEKYTNQLKLARIEKSINLLNAIHELDVKGISQSPDLAKIRDDLVSQLAETVIPTPTVVAIPAWSPAPSWKWKSLCASLPWLVLLIWQGKRYISSMAGPNASQAAKNVWATIFGGVVFAPMGAAIPTVWWPWLTW
jgi:hypothetical protein